MESPGDNDHSQRRTVPQSLPKILGLGRRVIVVGSVISGKDGHLGSSVAADALDGHLSHTQSSHGQRHGIYRALGTILFNSELGENRGNLSFRFGRVLQA